MSLNSRTRNWIADLKWTLLGVALKLNSLFVPQYTDAHDHGRVIQIRRALPLRSVLAVSLRLPTLFAAN